MRIALFTDSYLPSKNGVVTVVDQLYQNLKAQGHHVVIVTVSNHAEDENEQSENILRVPSTKIGFGMKDQYFGYPIFKKVSKFLKKNKIELIHCHTEFSIGIHAIHEARKLHIPVICTTHTMWEDYYKYYLPGGEHISPEAIRWLIRRFYGKMFALINVSQKAHNYFKKDYICPQIPSVIIPNSINAENYCHNPSSPEEISALREKLGIKDDEKMILFVGRIVEEKRVLELIDILDSALTKCAKAKAVFVGDGAAFKHVKKLAKVSENPKRFIFTGFIDWHEIHRYYEAADLFVTASLSEMHSMTILEAITSGLPVVVRKDESYNDTVIQGVNGFQSETDEEMALDIAKLCSDDEKLTEFGKQSSKIAQNFLPETFIDRHIKVYQTVLNAWKTKQPLTDELLAAAIKND